MRKLLFAIVLLLAVFFVLINLAEVQAVLETLQRGDWRFILLAFGVQLLWTLDVAACYHTVYRAIDLDEDISHLLLAVAGANSFNVLAPTGGVGGIAVFINQARRRGYSVARVTVAGALVVLFDYVAFLCLLSIGLVILFRRNNLNVTELSAAAFLFAAAVVLGVLLYLGMQSADSLARALAWMARQVNRSLHPFIHRDYLSEHRARSFAHEAAGGLHRLRQKPQYMLKPFLLSLIGKLLLLSILTLVFVAFKVPFTAGTVIGGFAIGYLFFIVSPTPAGIGFVEGALTLGLRSLSVPIGEATVITLAYRGITFWVPLLYGILAFRWLSHGHTTPEPETLPPDKIAEEALPPDHLPPSA
jgi:uncharacterized protein (TIRG00374 family)